MDEQERRLEISKQNQDYGKDKGNCENIALHYAKKCEDYEKRIKDLEQEIRLLRIDLAEALEYCIGDDIEAATERLAQARKGSNA